VWVGTDKEIARWNGHRFEEQTPTNGESDVNVAYLTSPTGDDCLVVANQKVLRLRNRRWMAELESWRELVSANPAYMDDYTDSKGRVWLRSFRLGLFYAHRDGAAHQLTSREGLPNDRISCWFEDHEGNIWLGVDRGGLVRLREKRVQVIGVPQGVQVPAISSVCEDLERNIWFGTFGGGLYRWHEDQLQTFSPSEQNNLKSFFSIYPDHENRLWLSAGNENLHRLVNGRIEEMSDPAHGIKSLLVDRQGRLWIGRQIGLACWTNGVLVNFSAGGGFDRVDVRAIAEDRRGVLWFGTGNGRLWKYEDNRFTSFQAGDAFESQAIRSLLPDEDGTLWVGTFRGGLLRFKDGRFTRYTTREGLPSDVICQLLSDGLDRLWIGSHKGIFCIPRKSFYELEDGTILSLPCVSLGLDDGLPTLECTGNYQPCSWRSDDGRLWFATVKGLVRVDPAEISLNPVAPPVVIEEIQLNGKPLGARNLSRRTHLDVPPGKHQLDFRYTALSFIAPDRVRFRYRLVGFDNDWVQADTKRTAHYGPLAPGRYAFEVAACNNDGVWNTQAASVGLVVLPQFWQTWWFQGLSAAAVLGALFGTVRITATRRLRRRLESLQQQRAVQRERERIAKDIHDDIGAGLTHIVLQSSLARRDSEGQVRTDLTHRHGPRTGSRDGRNRVGHQPGKRLSGRPRHLRRQVRPGFRDRVRQTLSHHPAAATAGLDGVRRGSSQPVPCDQGGPQQCRQTLRRHRDFIPTAPAAAHRRLRHQGQRPRLRPRRSGRV
jgi:hypothetical protein